MQLCSGRFCLGGIKEDAVLMIFLRGQICLRSNAGLRGARQRVLLEAIVRLFASTKPFNSGKSQKKKSEHGQRNQPKTNKAKNKGGYCSFKNYFI